MHTFFGIKSNKRSTVHLLINYCLPLDLLFSSQQCLQRLPILNFYEARFQNMISKYTKTNATCKYRNVIGEIVLCNKINRQTTKIL